MPTSEDSANLESTRLRLPGRRRAARIRVSPKMLLEEIIKPDSVLSNAHARSKKHCLEILSELLVRPYPEVHADDIFARLIERERLGCTCLSDGVAFPHCRVDGIEESSAALIKLSEPIDFDAQDGEPVDIVFGLLVPKDIDETHRADISAITAMLSEPELLERLRTANSSNQLYDALREAGAAEPAAPTPVAQSSA